MTSPGLKREKVELSTHHTRSIHNKQRAVELLRKYFNRDEFCLQSQKNPKAYNTWHGLVKLAYMMRQMVPGEELTTAEANRCSAGEADRGRAAMLARLRELLYKYANDKNTRQHRRGTRNALTLTILSHLHVLQLLRS